MRALFAYLILPSNITELEAKYLARTNRIAFWFFAAHVPLLMLIAALNGTNAGLAAALSAMTLLGPVVACAIFENPRFTSVMYGFTATLMGGLLVHFGQGPVQIEMHFYFFVVIALLSIFANPAVIVVATVMVPVHHALLWLWLPRSAFNYAAPLWVVGLHSLFVVVEAVASCFIARTFFDNVVGLEKIVAQRTDELDLKNRALQLVLDNTDQVLMTLDPNGAVGGGSSAMAERWLGEQHEGESFAAVLGRRNETVGRVFELAWQQVQDGFFSRELALAQLPSRLDFAGRTLRLEYKAVAANNDTLLVIGTDVTSELLGERLETEKRETLALFQRIATDRRGVLGFFQEADALVGTLEQGDPLASKRSVHTLKGLAGMFGVRTVAERCHELETAMVEGADPMPAPQLEALRIRWAQVKADIQSFLGRSGVIEVLPEDFDALAQALASERPHAELQRMVRRWRLEPVHTPLERARDQANDLAVRLNKTIRVEVRAHDLHLDPHIWSPLWAAFGHAIRNALDHGIEEETERADAGKDACGLLVLEAAIEHTELVLSVTDDGRGVPWERVKERASSRGLPCSTRAELVRALFADGITTKDEVTDVSGRGVGMGALRAVCEAMGGRLVIPDGTRIGTRLELRFELPLQSVEHAPSLRHAA